ncbi:MAG: DNA polymerase III subunit alpha [Deltaproteobacteria bacterium]|nr:DNA polymerase III subunit alpha [Deltaproteobacteria bacterium]
MSSFAHLHLHSQYSLLDGAIRLKDLFPRVKEYGMNAVALTDHGNMFGAVDFYKEAKKQGVKPIFGCEVYIADGEMKEKTSRRSYHFVLLAKNEEGYRNLTHLVSMGYLEGFYYNPRIDKALLRKHAAGLVGLSACLGGEVAQTLLNRGSDAAAETIREYQSIFEPESFFLEVQPNGLAEQEQVNEDLIKLAHRMNVRLVATNDCHYVDRKDARAHDCLMCIQTGKLVSDENRLKHDVDEYYLKPPEEMERAFSRIPEALECAAAIAELCNVKLELGKTYLPRFQPPGGGDPEGYLRTLAFEGLARRFAEMRDRGQTPDEQTYRERLELELDVIQRMGFSSYFLIVWDFIRFAKEKGVPVGPGRGSGAGSLAAYSLRITDLDPLPYNLLFERFLNPERVSMPDFDVDFCKNRRGEVIRYVTEKYGRDNVGQIVTMHQLKARGVTRDVARVLGISYAEADQVAKLIPEPIAGKHVSIPEALAQEPRLKELAAANPKVAELLEIASALEGLNRHAGTHAAGIVIGERPLWEYVPCFRGQEGELVTQFAMKEVEEAGLVKFDFLGLKTLTILDDAVRMINRDGAVLDLQRVPLDDRATYEMIGAGNTTGVFQLESSGFKELLKKLQPDCFEDIVAAVALYRPGPLEGGMVDDFIKRKHGQTAVTYLHPWLEPLLKETYGVIVYQEQVMQIASTLAGFSLGQADLLRRAMGKKKPEEMAKQKEIFLRGAAEKEVSAQIAEQVFDLMEVFAGYGFNKSHSAAYALISYQTAYLKCHFPAEFMAAVLTAEKDDLDGLTKYIAETRAMGIQVLRPDVNESLADFSVLAQDGVPYIRFGMGAVRNVGGQAVEAIVEARRERPFDGLFDCCERVDARRANKRVMEALIKSGAFDDIAAARKVGRAQLMGALDAAQERALSAQKDRESGQTSLFGLLGGGSAAPASVKAASAEEYPNLPEWEPRQRLAFEKESLGFYVSGHPLDRYAEDLRRHASTTVGELDKLPDRTELSVGGLVTEYRERPLKSGKGRMAFFMLEDQGGQVEVVVFSKPFEEHESVLKCGEPILVQGRLAHEGEEESKVQRLHLKSAVTLADLRKQKTTQVHLHLRSDIAQETQIEQLKQILLAHVGECRTYVHVAIPDRSATRLVLSERYSVAPTDELLFKLERLFGERVAVLK